ncbi:MAG: glutaredoxin family protein [Phototrophicaceae bacterium]|jgi:hypothetical protein
MTPEPRDKWLVMYTRTLGCPFVSIAERVLHEYSVTYHPLFIDRDPAACRRVLEWTGFQSVPTLIVAWHGELEPISAPTPLVRGTSPQGIDRGDMLTEARDLQLITWLRKHGFITQGVS